MKRFLVMMAIVVLSVPAALHAQEDVATKVEEMGSQIGGMDEAIKELQHDRDAMKKIKISGYIQMNWEKTESMSGFGSDPYDASDEVKSRFRLRRSRLKFQYSDTFGRLVIQGDFGNAKFELKDAYLEFDDPWIRMMSLRFGVFNRPTYEVEYSSSQRESVERSAVTRALYPGERDMGAMLTVSPEDMFTLQLAAFNNTQLGTFSQSNPNYGTEPLYFMARLTKTFTLGDLGLDVGAHARLGNVRLNTNSVIESDSPASGSGAVVDTTTYKVGDGLARNWFGFEAQLYYDFLGGMKIMGEYMMGQDVNQLSTSATPSPARVRDFTGWYIMLVKNLGTDFQFAVKYDTYAPNSTLDYDMINTSSELTRSTLGLGIHNYSFDNVRLTLWYDMNTTKTNEFTSGSTKPFSADPIDNLLTFRAQYKF
ncbi:MAG: hypothetical protein WBQ23_16010 [Bacteroidota bacterium]